MLPTLIVAATISMTPFTAQDGPAETTTQEPIGIETPAPRELKAPPAAEGSVLRGEHAVELVLPTDPALPHAPVLVKVRITAASDLAPSALVTELPDGIRTTHGSLLLVPAMKQAEIREFELQVSAARPGRHVLCVHLKESFAGTLRVSSGEAALAVMELPDSERPVRRSEERRGEARANDGSRRR